MQPEPSVPHPPTSADASPATDAPPLPVPVAGPGLPWGTEWELVDVPAPVGSAAQAAGAEVAWSSVRITLGLQQERAGGRSGVNRYVGMCRDLGSGGIELGPFGMTMMAGPPEAMAAEQAYLALLDRVRGYRAWPDGLVLRDAAGVDLLAFRPAPDPR